MNSYNKDVTEILDIPVQPSMGNNTMTFDSWVSAPAGLNCAVTVAADGKSATALVSAGVYPNTYACKIYFNLSDGAKRAVRLQVVMVTD